MNLYSICRYLTQHSTRQDLWNQKYNYCSQGNISPFFFLLLSSFSPGKLKTGEIKTILNDCDCANCANPFASAEGRKLKIKNIGATFTPYSKSHRGVEDKDEIRSNFLHSKSYIFSLSSETF